MPGAHTKRNATAREGRYRNQAGSTAGPTSNQPEPYDGPGSNAGEVRGRSASVAGTRSSSRPGSQVRAGSQTRQAVDPARDPVPQVLLRNVDFGGAAYNIFDQVSQKFACLPRSPCHSAHSRSPTYVVIVQLLCLLDIRRFWAKMNVGWLHSIAQKENSLSLSSA